MLADKDKEMINRLAKDLEMEALLLEKNTTIARLELEIERLLSNKEMDEKALLTNMSDPIIPQAPTSDYTVSANDDVDIVPDAPLASKESNNDYTRSSLYDRITLLEYSMAKMIAAAESAPGKIVTEKDEKDFATAEGKNTEEKIKELEADVGKVKEQKLDSAKPCETCGRKTDTEIKEVVLSRKERIFEEIAAAQARSVEDHEIMVAKINIPALEHNGWMLDKDDSLDPLWDYFRSKPMQKGDQWDQFPYSMGNAWGMDPGRVLYLARATKSEVQVEGKTEEEQRQQLLDHFHIKARHLCPSHCR